MPKKVKIKIVKRKWEYLAMCLFWSVLVSIPLYAFQVCECILCCLSYLIFYFLLIFFAIYDFWKFLEYYEEYEIEAKKVR